MVKFINTSESLKKLVKDIYFGLSRQYKLKPNIIVEFFEDKKKFEGKIKRRLDALEAGVAYKNRLFLFVPEKLSTYTLWTKQNTRKIYLHEMAHAFNFQLNKEICPIWLEEGIASYLSSMYNERCLQLLFDKLIDFNDLFFKEDWNKQKTIIAYYQSASFVKYLARRYSTETVMSLKKKSTKDKAKFEQEFSKIFKRNLHSHISDWKAYLKNAKFKEINTKWLRDIVKNEKSQ
ncbi:MAG: hypothetical protein KAT43_06070 [Nanoarchaeota archaeon]|nr:hypothetical protein [Nanoarchaeota archaeon]